MSVQRWFRPSVLAPLLCLIYAIVVALAAGHTLVWVTPPEKKSPEEIKPYAYSEWGYDGYYVYAIAHDPQSAPQYVDVAPYRFQRALLSALARFFSFGNPDLVQYAILAINLLALAVGTRMLELLLKEAGYNPWYAVGYAFSLPAFGSARFAMTEPLAYGLVLVAMVLAGRQKWQGSAVFFALAALTKETTLFFPAAYGLYLLYRRQWKQAIPFGIITLLPFVIWELLIYAHFGTWGISSGGSTDSGFELLPFGAYFRILERAGLGGFLFLNLLLFPAVIVPIVWSFWRCLRDFRQGKWTLQTQVLFANVLILPFTPFSTFSEPIAIFRFIVGLQIALIWYAAHQGLRRPLLYSTLWMFTGTLAVSSDYFTLFASS